MRFPFLLLVAALSPLSLAQAQGAKSNAKPGVKTAPKTALSKRAKIDKQVDVLWLKSDEAFHNGDYPLSIRYHRQIVKLDPTVIDSYTNAAWLMWSLGNGDEARAFLAQGLKANPKDPEMWDGAAQQYELQKRTAMAFTAYGKAVQLSGAKADQMLRRRYAHAARHAGQLSKSAEIWRALVADYPGEVVNKRNLAQVEAQIAGAASGAASGAAPPVAFELSGAPRLA